MRRFKLAEFEPTALNEFRNSLRETGPSRTDHFRRRDLEFWLFILEDIRPRPSGDTMFPEAFLWEIFVGVGHWQN